MKCAKLKKQLYLPNLTLKFRITISNLSHVFLGLPDAAYSLILSNKPQRPSEKISTDPDIKLHTGFYENKGY